MRPKVNRKVLIAHRKHDEDNFGTYENTRTEVMLKDLEKEGKKANREQDWPKWLPGHPYKGAFAANHVSGFANRTCKNAMPVSVVSCKVFDMCPNTEISNEDGILSLRSIDHVKTISGDRMTMLGLVDLEL